MKYLLASVSLILLLICPVSALDITAPPAPDSVQAVMPDRAESFGEGLLELLGEGLRLLAPQLAQASRSCLGVCAGVLCVSVLSSFSGAVKNTAELTGAVVIATLLLSGADSLLRLGTATVTQLSEYGKLLLPVMTAAMAAQGGVSGSAALYTGTTIFDTVLSSLLSTLAVPLIYLYLALAAANAAIGEELLKKCRDFIKWLLTWCLKIILYVFTGYMGITGVISGTTDAAVLKATKITISGAVPVVGGILSEASEAVLVSAGLVKNAAGVYGIFALLAIFLNPFIRIGAHYLMLKLTSAVCGVYGSKRISDLIGDFSTAMGFVLAMTGSVCLLLLISTVCFMRGVG